MDSRVFAKVGDSWLLGDFYRVPLALQPVSAVLVEEEFEHDAGYGLTRMLPIPESCFLALQLEEGDGAQLKAAYESGNPDATRYHIRRIPPPLDGMVNLELEIER
ncbi:hypothetical protein [Ferrimonas pelagia]|uniref:hypothetical protein n=1 Tax=Ferrimonas pelagia TaxID=1177826 RepID=UPI0031F0B912